MVHIPADTLLEEVLRHAVIPVLLVRFVAFTLLRAVASGRCIPSGRVAHPFMLFTADLATMWVPLDKSEGVVKRRGILGDA